jgi:purine-binding chemotaxis protein CheW
MCRACWRQPVSKQVETRFWREICAIVGAIIIGSIIVGAIIVGAIKEAWMSVPEQLCTFFLEDQFFGVPVQEVQEVIRYQEMTAVPLVPAAVSGLINLRGQIVTALDLRRRLNFGPRPPGQLPMNVVVRTPEGALSLLVDEIGDVIEVSAATLEPPPATVRNLEAGILRGVHKLPGRLLLVLNMEQVVNVVNSADETVLPARRS